MLVFFAITFYISLVSSYIPFEDHTAFQSPDENSNYITTKLYSETGKLYYIANYSELDDENYLHPRGFVTYNNKVVSVQFFGLPIIYGHIYLFFEESIKILFPIIFSLVSLIFFVKTAIIIFPKSEFYAAICFLSISPLIYYFNHPYYNVTPAITFFIIGFYYLVKFFQHEHYNYYILSALLFSLSVFCRNNYGLFIFILVASILINKYKNEKIVILKYLLVSAFFAIVFAILPTALLNYELYENPLLLGNSLLGKYIIESPSSAYNFFGILFPSPVIPITILKNANRLFLNFLPMLSFLSIIGLSYVIKEKKINKSNIYYVLFFIYLLSFRGSSNTYSAYNFDYIGFNVAIIRYWLIIYLLFGLFAVGGLLAISKMNKKIITVLCITVLIITSINILFIETQYSLIHDSNTLSKLDERALTIQKEINEKSIIYSTYQSKILSPYNVEVATWWQDTYDPIKLANSMTRLYKNTDYSIYLYKEKSVDITELNSILENENLTLKMTGDVTKLYELTSI